MNASSTAPQTVAPHHATRATWSGLLARLAPYRRHVPFLLVLVVAVNLLTINLNVPWGSNHEDNGIFNETIAINHIRFGLGVTKGQDLFDYESTYASTDRHPYSIPGVPDAEEFTYLLHGPVHTAVYGHHPPLMDLTIAAGFLVLGYHFWVVRLMPILFALGGLVLFYFLLLYLFDPLVAALASLLYATFPMFAYFGRNVSHEAFTLFWALVLLTGYVHWLRDPRRRWLALMAASIVVGGFYGWPMYFFATMVFVVHWVATRRFDRALALVTVLPAVVTFALVLAQLDWALGGSLTKLIAAFTTRSGSAPATLFEWLQRLRRFNAESFGTWAELATPFALLFVYFRARIEGWSPRMRMLAIVFCAATIHVLAFRDGAYNHAYWQFYFLPFFATILGWGGVALARRYLTQPAQQAIVVAAAGVIAVMLDWPGIAAFYGTDVHHHFVWLASTFLP